MTTKIRPPRTIPDHVQEQARHRRAVAKWGDVLSPVAACAILDGLGATGRWSDARRVERRDSFANEGPLVRKHRAAGFDRGVDWARDTALWPIYQLLVSTGFDPNATWASHCWEDKTLQALRELSGREVRAYCRCSECRAHRGED